MRLDVLIVGQGLAGSLLAWELIQHQQRVLVIDTGEINASQVAAGLINPVTGLRLLKNPDIELLLPCARRCYQQLGQSFNDQFIIDLPMLRILRSQSEQGYALKRLGQPEYQPYLQAWLPAVAGINSACGVMQQSGTAYLRTQALLTALRDFFIESGRYRRGRLAYEDIVLQPRLCWREVQTRHIVFCEGHQAGANPWFGALPFQLAKGEILSGVTAGDLPTQILNYGHWLIPLADGCFKTGATFDTQNLNTLPSQAAANQLIDALYKVFPAVRPAVIRAHQAGIRPTTLDKQPFIGQHPYHANLHVFNGFGSKGSLGIPWYARQMSLALLQQQPLPPAVDVKRYYPTHFPA